MDSNETTTETVVIPRVQGQDFGITMPVFLEAEKRLGHRADPNSSERSRNLVYRRKVAKQKARAKA
jgi:hypothetical protein